MIRPSVTDKTPPPIPIKSGEVFRTACGKFSFVCTYCRSVWRSCDLLMIHINSHFKATKTNVDIAESPLALPEFVSIGVVVKTEPGLETPIGKTEALPTPITGTSVAKSSSKQLSATETSKFPHTIKTTIASAQSSPSTGASVPTQALKVLNATEISKLSDKTRIVRVVTRTNDINVAMALLNTDTNKTADPGDKSTPLRTRRILKVIKRNHSTDDTKLSPNKILKLERKTPDTSQIEVKNKPSATIDLTSNFDEPKTDVKPVVTEPQPESNEHNGDGQVTEPNKKVYVRRSCYQCDMEPKIQRPCDPRRHRCPLCRLYFPTHDEFYRHVKDIHKKDPAFVHYEYYYCYACELRYPFRPHLVTHVKSHLGDPETYLCAICGSNFPTRKKFMVHMDNHGERKFKCDHCGKAFKHLWVLKQHLLCHKKCSSTHICEICSKAFKFNKYLRRHMAVHEEPKISCRHCDAKFHFVSVRRAHEQNRHNVV